MRRKLLALFSATAVALVGAVAFAAGPAQAATPAPSIATTGDHESDCLQPQKPEITLLSFSRTQIALPCRQITFVDNCDETVTVNVANTADADSPFDVRFRIQLDGPDWVSKALNGGDSDSVTLAADDNEDIQVQSRYPAGVGPWLNFGDEHSWSWNASCLEVTSVSNCDGTFKVSVKNTSTEDGEFVWSLGLNDSTETNIEAGATLSENFTKGDVVQIRVGKDNEVVKTLEFVQPTDCATASPSPSPSVSVTTSAPTTTAPAPVLNGPDLPTTGDSLTKPAVTGGVALALGGLLLLSMFLKRRRTAAEVTEQE